MVAINPHCRTQTLKGAYKAGRGKTATWKIPPSAIDYYQAHQPRQYIRLSLLRI